MVEDCIPPPGIGPILLHRHVLYSGDPAKVHFLWSACADYWISAYRRYFSIGYAYVTRGLCRQELGSFPVPQTAARSYIDLITEGYGQKEGSGTSERDPLLTTTRVAAKHTVEGGTMTHEPTELISRIQWCRLQQLHSITPDERAGWRAEEAGLVDALGCRNRIDFMRQEHRAHFGRYQCGLEDGQAILRLSTSTQMNSRPSQSSRPVHIAFRG